MNKKCRYCIFFMLLMIFTPTYADLLGDVNSDGKINSMDYILVRKHIIGVSKLTSNQQKLADMNSDNNVNAIDYILIKKSILGIAQDVSVTSVTLNNSSISLKVGENTTLSAAINPSNATNKTITWTSSNTSVATVSNGKITGIKAGTAIITATTSNNKTAKCTVTVNQNTETVATSKTYKKQFDITFFRGVFARYLDDTQVQYMKNAYFTLIALEDSWDKSISYNEYKNNMIKAIQLLGKNNLRVNIYDWMALWRNLGYEGGNQICSYSGDKLKPCLNQMLNDYKKYSNVAEYYVLDEPDASASTQSTLKYAIDYIRTNDSGSEGYINLLPNYAFDTSTYRSNYLEPLASGVRPKVLSVDHYPQMFLGANVTNSKTQYYNNLWDIHVVSDKYDMIPMMITLLSAHDGYKNLSRSEIAYQVSTSLAFGMKRISYFTYSSDGNSGLSNALVDSNHNRTTHYYDVQSVNKSALKIGTYLFDKKLVNTYGLNEVSYMGNYNAWKKDITATKSGIISAFDDNSYMLVNTEILPTPTTNVFTFETMKGLHYYDTDKEQWVKVTSDVSKDTFQIYPSSRTIYISPGGCILLKGRYWFKDTQGYWYYKEVDGSNVKSEWVYYNGLWYYLGSNGVMYANTTQIIDGVSYHFNASGACDQGPGC